MTTREPLTDAQRQRLAVLYDTWSALHVGELNSYDLIRCAHWVWNGQELSANEPRDVCWGSPEPDSAPRTADMA